MRHCPIVTYVLDMKKNGWALLALLTTFACQHAASVQESAPVAEATPEPSPRFDLLSRHEFNARALRHGLPLFWSDDSNNNQTLDPSELAIIWGMEPAPSLGEYVLCEQFTPQFSALYQNLAASNPAADSSLDKRQAALEKELSQGYFTLLSQDFSQNPEQDRELVKHVLNAAVIIERIFMKQRGTWDARTQIPANDGRSSLIYFLNHGPECTSPLTEKDPDCTALPSTQALHSGLYPSDVQAEKNFCDTLAKLPNHEALFNPFVTVQRDSAGKFVAVPYNVAYADDMQMVSQELRAAADAIQTPDEAAFKAYLQSAAQAFLDNNWYAADEAWAKMNALNSKWYLRIQPDEVYFEPCSRKAGFHVSFALINKSSVEWQQKLDPLKNEMEKALAAHAGTPYKARKVNFHLPDFIDVVINAGDSRDAHGATVGQSLPNWGPVANEGRGRTVTMTNFYTDPDSIAIRHSQASALFCNDTMAFYSDDPSPELMSVILHEAAHNLGPAHEYKVKGKVDDEIFGGPLASTLEELKAQTSALYFSDWLAQKGVIPNTQAEQAHIRDIAWAFGHISRGLFDADGKPKPYSQLAAIQAGFLHQQNALIWHPDGIAANGSDQGCFSVDMQQFSKAADLLTTTVLGIKGRGDKAQATKLTENFVTTAGEWKTLMDTITERYVRYPRASFLYNVRL